MYRLAADYQPVDDGYKPIISDIGQSPAIVCQSPAILLEIFQNAALENQGLF